MSPGMLFFIPIFICIFIVRITLKKLNIHKEGRFSVMRDRPSCILKYLIMEEIFKDIPGYESIYQVSNFGRVKSITRYVKFKDNRLRLVTERILKQSLATSGYLVVDLCKDKHKIHKIHQLVAMAFLNHTPNGYKLVVDHIDFIKVNNFLSNLRLISSRENSNQKHLKSVSKFIGVFLHNNSKKWVAQITINRKRIHIGCFTEERKAGKAYLEALDLHNNNLSITPIINKYKYMAL